MAKNLIFQFDKITTGFSGLVLARVDYRIFYDDQSLLYTVEVKPSSSAAAWRTLNQEDYINSVSEIPDGVVSAYSYCAGGSLIEFISKNTPGQNLWPFAFQRVTANSSQCQPTVRPFSVTATGYNPTASGNDGRIVAVANSPSGSVTYTLRRAAEIATIESKTGTFTQLPAGTYYVRAVDWYVQTPEVEVILLASAAVEYGLFAFTEVTTSSLRKPLRINIRKQGFTGAARETCVVNMDSVRLSRKGSTNELGYAPILSSSMEFSLLSEDIRDWTVLYTQDDREYLIEMSVSGEVVFAGYLLPELSDQQHRRGNHKANFTASDGLSTLKDVDFLDADARPYSGAWKLSEIVKLCLKAAMPQANVLFAVEWYPVRDSAGLSFTNVSGNALSEQIIDIGAFYTESGSTKTPDCAAVLTRILERNNLQVGQYGKDFLLHHPLSQSTENIVAYYTENGVEKSIMLSRYSISSCTLTDGDNITNTTTTNIGILPGIETVTIEEKLQPSIGLVPNSNLEDFSKWKYNAFGEAVSVEGWLTRQDNSAFALVTPLFDTNYVPSPSASNPRRLSGNRKADGMVFRRIRAESFATYGDFKIVQAVLPIVKPENEVYNFLIEKKAELSFLFYLKFRCRKVDFPVRMRFGLVWIEQSGKQFHLSADGKSWTRQSSALSYVFSENEMDKDVEVSIITPTLPYTSDFRQGGAFYINIVEPDVAPSASFESPVQLINLLNQTKNVLAIKSVQLKPMLSGAELLTSRNTSKKSVVSGKKQSYTTKSLSRKLELSGGYGGRNERVFYPFVPFFDNGPISDANAETIKHVYRKGSFEVGKEEKQYYHVAQLAEFYAQRSVPRETLSGELYGKFEYFQTLRIVVDQNVEYIAQNLTYIPSKDSFSGEFLYKKGNLVERYIRVHEDGSRMLSEDGQYVRTHEKTYQYDEDFTADSAVELPPALAPATDQGQKVRDQIREILDKQKLIF